MIGKIVLRFARASSIIISASELWYLRSDSWSTMLGMDGHRFVTF